MALDTCFQHPDRPAVEHCEICRRPVCGSCLWYADSGERLCPDHAEEFQAQGKAVVPPERYAEGIPHSETSAVQPSAADVPYRGNSTDVGALIAAVCGVVALAACGGLSWVIPLLAVALGLVGWLQARDAVNPQRTRWLSLVGLAGGGVFLLFIAGFIVMMGLCMFIPLLAGGLGSWGGFPTSTPFPFPTP